MDGQVYIPKAATPNPTIRKSIQNNILSVVAYKAATREGIVILVREFNGVGEYDLSLENAARYKLDLLDFISIQGSLNDMIQISWPARSHS